MLSKEYLDTARTIFRVAQTMTDQRVASQLKTLAEGYERRAERAALVDADKALARSAAREREHSVDNITANMSEGVAEAALFVTHLRG